MKSSIISIWVLVISIGIGAFTNAQDRNANDENVDGNFLNEVIQANSAEVRLGQLARQKSNNSEVRTFGSMLEDDHSAANKAAQKLAQSSNIAVSVNPNNEQDNTYDRLSQLSGSQFDAEFTAVMIKDHRQNIEKFEIQAVHGDDATSQYARQFLPVLHHHLEIAEHLQDNKTKSTD